MMDEGMKSEVSLGKQDTLPESSTTAAPIGTVGSRQDTYAGPVGIAEGLTAFGKRDKNTGCMQNARRATDSFGEAKMEDFSLFCIGA
jgi:hypothetical protein